MATTTPPSTSSGGSEEESGSTAGSARTSPESKELARPNLLNRAKHTWTAAVGHVKDAPKKPWDGLKGQRVAAIIALLALIVATWTLLHDYQVARQYTEPELAPPANSKCTYDLGYGFDKAINWGFNRDAVIEQNIDNQVKDLSSLTSIRPVIDYDRSLVNSELSGVTIQLVAGDQVIEEQSFGPASIKTRPAPFDFAQPVKIDHSKSYKLVVRNTTGNDIVIWVNQTGPSLGYPKASLNGTEVDGSLSGQVCGF
jgi:hypothetical protein